MSGITDEEQRLWRLQDRIEAGRLTPAEATLLSRFVGAIWHSGDGDDADGMSASWRVTRKRLAGLLAEADKNVSTEDPGATIPHNLSGLVASLTKSRDDYLILDSDFAKGEASGLRLAIALVQIYTHGQFGQSIDQQKRAVDMSKNASTEDGES